MWSFSGFFLQAVGKKSGHGWPGATGHGVSGWRPRPLKGDQLGTDLKLGEDISAANAGLCPSSWEPPPWSPKISWRKSYGPCTHLEKQIFFRTVWLLTEFISLWLSNSESLASERLCCITCLAPKASLKRLSEVVRSTQGNLPTDLLSIYVWVRDLNQL